jgi:hypothetical protein
MDDKHTKGVILDPPAMSTSGIHKDGYIVTRYNLNEFRNNMDLKQPHSMIPWSQCVKPATEVFQEVNSLCKVSFVEKDNNLLDYFHTAQYLYTVHEPLKVPSSELARPGLLFGYGFCTYEKIKTPHQNMPEKYMMHIIRIQVRNSKQRKSIAKMVILNMRDDGCQWAITHQKQLGIWFRTFSPFTYLTAQSFFHPSVINPQYDPIRKDIIYTDQALFDMNSVIELHPTLLGSSPDPKYPFLFREAGAKKGISLSKLEVNRIKKMMASLPATNPFRALNINCEKGDTLFCVITDMRSLNQPEKLYPANVAALKHNRSKL